MRPRLMPNETARLRNVMANPSRKFCFTSHSRDEMRADGIIEADIRRVLEQGQVTWMEVKKDQLWHVEGKDVDGRSIRAIVVVNETLYEIKIVTVMTI